MAEEVKKFTLINPFEYEREHIKEILVRRLCVDAGYYRKTAEHIIEHTNNLFGGVFKRAAQAEIVSSTILFSYNVYISPAEIGRIKTLKDLVIAVGNEAKKKGVSLELNEDAYNKSINLGATPRIKKISKREIENRNWYGLYNSDYYEPGGNY